MQKIRDNKIMGHIENSDEIQIYKNAIKINIISWQDRYKIHIQI